MLFVSHNMAAIQNLCKKSMLLQSGCKAKMGDTYDVIKTYLNYGYQNNDKQELSYYEKRRGNGFVKFKSAKLLGKNNQIKRKFDIGDDLRILLQLESYFSVVEKNIAISIVIKTDDGMKVCNMVNLDSKFQIDKIDSEEEFLITIQDMRFYPGNYLISIWAGNTLGSETYDAIEDCLFFEIISGGQLTTRSLPRNTGLIFLTPKWEKISK